MNLFKAGESIKLASSEYVAARRVAELGFLLALGLVLHWVEGFFPPLVPLPGVKLGLANVVPLFLLLSGRPKEAVWINVLRILLGSFLGGNFLGIAFFMSFLGGVSSLLGMMLIYRRTHSALLLSVGGALFHNLGQWWMAVLWVRSWGLVFYLPFLLALALPAGCLVGYLGVLLRREEVERVSRRLR
ncbi:MAG: Gx transporter family protein [Candidatus Caldatribacteriaceae bacterium]